MRWTRAVSALVIAVAGTIVFSGCGNSNFFPSQTAIVSLSMSPANDVVDIGATVSFTATGTLGNNSTEDVTSRVTWSSSNTGIATINASGVATGVADGVTTITGSTGKLKVQGTLLVSNITGISISPTSWTAAQSGATQQFTATGTGGNAATVTNYVTWSSSDTSCATITTAGLATFVGTLGTSSCNITATLGQFSATATVGGGVI